MRCSLQVPVVAQHVVGAVAVVVGQVAETSCLNLHGNTACLEHEHAVSLAPRRAGRQDFLP